MQAVKVLFGNLAHEYIKEAGLTVAEVAAKVPGTPASQFTRWKRGRWGFIEEGKLVKLIEAITDDPQKQANLAVAYAVDMIPMRFRPMIDVGLRGEVKDGTNTAEELAGPWSQDVRRKLEVIGRAYSKDEDYQKMADQLASWARRILRASEQT